MQQVISRPAFRTPARGAIGARGAPQSERRGHSTQQRSAVDGIRALVPPSPRWLMLLPLAVSRVACSRSSGCRSRPSGRPLGQASLCGRAAKRSRLSSRTEVVKRRAQASLGAGGAIETFIIRGKITSGNIATNCAALAAYFDLGCVIFFTVGVDPSIVASAAAGALGLHGACPVYVAVADGIVGWDRTEGKNVVLRVSDGDEGVVCAGFRGGGHAGSSCATGELGILPEGCSLHMVVTTGDMPEKPPEGAVYGGNVEACYRLEHSGDLVEVAYFAVSSPFAVMSNFEAGELEKSVDAAWQVLPPVAQPPLAGGLFAPPKSLSDIEEHGGDVHCTAVRLFGMISGAFGPPPGEPIKCIPGIMKWGSILDDDPRPEITGEEGGGRIALYGK